MADNTIPQKTTKDDDTFQIAPFDPTKKKKKKTKKKKKFFVSDKADDSLGLVEAAGIGKEHVEGDELIQQSRHQWVVNERDYQYKELLQRLYCFLHENNPQLAGDRQRTVLRPPKILREGTTNTVFVNFMDLCKTMHRPPEHVIDFMFKELGTVMSLDGDNRLVVKEKSGLQSLEDLLQRYISEYVLCNCCRSPDTILSKDKHILLLQCEMCGTEQSVPPITSAYSARADRRKTKT